MSAEIDGLKRIYHYKDEAFITHGYRNWRRAIENFSVHKKSDCRNDYVNRLCQSPPVMSMKALTKHYFAKRPVMGRYF